MSSPRFGLRVSSVLFGLMSLGQLWRLVAQPELLVSGQMVPVWPSGLAFLVLLGLAIWLWKLSGKASG